jgi:hypothetical protein
MLTIDLFEELEGPPEPTLIDALRDFLPIAVKHLKIKKLPKIKLLRDVETGHLVSLAMTIAQSIWALKTATQMISYAP